MDFDDILLQKVHIVEECLKECILPDIDYKTPIFEAMHYSLYCGGKRLRPVLLLAACEASGGNLEDAKPFLCAIELIHNYSLIHDDLPAMDNDDYRRGRLTNHKVFGEAMAILAGDGLLHQAMEIMADACAKDSEKAHQRALAMQAIAHGAGIYGMLAGQALDVDSEGKEVDEWTLQFIHMNKTAALIEAALKAGVLLGNGEPSRVEAFARAGRALGLAFQIQDDILDVTGTMEELGKPIHSDEKNNKVTFVSMYGLDSAKEKVASLLLDASEIWKRYQKECQFLSDLTNHLLNRRS